MHPLIHIGTFSIPSYLLFLILALITALFTAEFIAPTAGISRKRFLLPALAAVAAGIAGSELPAALIAMGLDKRLGIAALGTKGLAVQPALLLGGIALALSARGFHIKATDALDLASPAAAAAIPVARIGCLMGGCCWGKPTLFLIALVFRDFRAPARPIGVPLHATQLYEGAACILIALYLAFYRVRKKRFSGQVLLEFVILYSLQRFANEFLRANPWGPTLWNLSVPQLISLIAMAAASLIYAAAMARDRFSRPRDIPQSR